MAGISSMALAFGSPENKKGYNGNELQNKEFSDGSGLDAYDFNARTYDQQIGRFIQIDPLSDEEGQESLTPYHFTFNNPILYNDPDGKIPPIVLAYRIIRTMIWLEKVTQPKSIPILRGPLLRDNTTLVQPVFTPIVLPSQQSSQQQTKEQAEQEVGQLQSEVNSIQRAKRSHEKNIQEHQQKLEDYKRDPDKYDNQGTLRDSKPEVREKIIQGRIKKLENDVKKQKGELEKTNKQLEQKQKLLNEKSSLLKTL